MWTYLREGEIKLLAYCLIPIRNHHHVAGGFPEEGCFSGTTSTTFHLLRLPKGKRAMLLEKKNLAFLEDIINKPAQMMDFLLPQFFPATRVIRRCSHAT